MSLIPISPSRSSWIRAIGYIGDRTTSDGHTYLAIFSDSFAWLVQDVPSTLPGLLAAGHVTAKDNGDLSIGAAVHRFVLQKESVYPRQKVEGKEMWMLAVSCLANQKSHTHGHGHAHGCDYAKKRRNRN